MGGELTYKKDRFSAGLGYHYFKDEKDWTAAYGDKSANIWTVGLGYKFGSDFRLSGAYAQNVQGQSTKGDGTALVNSSAQRRAYNIQLNWRGAQANKPGTWGLEAGYRHLGRFAALCPTYDYFDTDMKGWFVGGNVTIFKNVLGYVGYSSGKTIESEKKQNIIWGRVRFLF